RVSPDDERHERLLRGAPARRQPVQHVGVCRNVTTGKRSWHFPTRHHDIFDYDNPAAPIMADLTVDGRRIRAVVQVTKQAFAYVFDRVTGKPVWPIEERPVPSATVPGERASRTQPFPTRPPAFDR